MQLSYKLRSRKRYIKRTDQIICKLPLLATCKVPRPCLTFKKCSAQARRPDRERTSKTCPPPRDPRAPRQPPGPRDDPQRPYAPHPSNNLKSQTHAPSSLDRSRRCPCRLSLCTDDRLVLSHQPSPCP